MNFGLNRRTVFLVSFFETIALSAMVFILVDHWYPDSYFDLFGVSHKLLAFLAVLALLGPVLCTIFYKLDSSAYVNDLCVIFIVKLVVLAVGLHLAYSQRPVLVVFSVDRLVVVQAHHINLSHVPPGILKAIKNADVPPLIAAKKLSEENVGVLLEVMSGGLDIEYRPAQYENFKYQQDVFHEQMCSSSFEGDREVAGYERRCESLEVPLVYDSDRFATAIFDSKSASLDKIIYRDPW